MALGYGSAAGSLSVGRFVGAALAQAPAVWLVAALAVAAYTLRSSWAVLGWAFLVLFLTLGQLGELLSLPQWVIDLSPYVHVPRMPVEAFTAGPSSVLTLLAAVLLVGVVAALPHPRHRLATDVRHPVQGPTAERADRQRRRTFRDPARAVARR